MVADLQAEITEQIRKFQIERWAGDLDRAGIEVGELDSLVHDVANSVASGVNNDGLHAQTEFLMDHMCLAEFTSEMHMRILDGVARTLRQAGESCGSRFTPETADAVYQALNPLRQLAEDDSADWLGLSEALEQVDLIFQEGRKRNDSEQED